MTIPGAIPPPGAEPLDPTVLDLLRGSSLAPMLDQPVNHILQDMGLPNLPEMPSFIHLPEMPPLPPLDLTALMRPLTDLAAAFGSGKLGAPPAPAPTNADGTQNAAAPPMDPTQLLTGISTVMQTVMQVGTSAIQTAMSVWQGLAAMEAAKKSGEAATDAGKLETQSVQEKAVLTNAAGSVFTGAGLMSAVVAKMSTTLALAPLYAATPAGQVFLAASAVESMAEALGITVKTKGELLGHSATMTTTGTKVPITNAPKGVAGAGGADQLSQLMGMVTPLISTATTAAQSLGQLAQASSALSAPKPVVDSKTHEAGQLSDDEKAKAEAAAASGVGGPGAFGGPGPGAAGAPAAPLNPWQGTRVASGSMGSLTGLSGVGGSSPASTAAMSSGGTGGMGGMPMGAAGAAGLGKDGGSSSDGLRGQLVTSQHGDEVVGRIEGVSLPVVGAADTTSEPPPDKELTL